MIMALCFGLPASAHARSQNAAAKFGRGFTNLAGSPLELFIQPVRIATIDHKPALTWTLGPFQGLYFMVVRAVVGVEEMLTFPWPGPTHYGPILLPETVHDGLMALSLKEWPYPRNGFTKKEDPLDSHGRL